jgi:hypothetical protein
MLDAADDAASRRRGAVSRLIFLVHTIRHQMRCLATEANVTRMRLSAGWLRLESRNIIADFLSHNSLYSMRMHELYIVN